VRKALRAAAAALLLGAGAAAVMADEHDDARRLRDSGQILPLEEILERIRGRYPGRVIEVELEHPHRGGYRYELEILGPDGIVRKLRVDAVTGRLLDRGE